MGAQLAVLGTGDKPLEDGLADAAARHPGRAATVIGYEEAFAHLLQGGVDALLVPSRFEPCGLTQLCALRYGAIPIVSRVGGLADTVIDANAMAVAARTGTGIQFAPVTRRTLELALGRALTLARDPPLWRRLQLRAMAADVGWTRPAKQYAALYRALAAQRADLTDGPRRSRESRAARRDARARRREHRGVLDARDRHRLVPVRRVGNDRARAHRAARAHRRRVPRLRGRHRRRATGTVCARTARTIRATATASTRRSSSSTRTQERSTARSRCTPPCSAPARTTPRATTPTARRSCRKAIVTVPPVLAFRRAAARAVGRDGRLRNARARIHAHASRRAGSTARHVRGPRASRRPSRT